MKWSIPDSLVPKKKVWTHRKTPFKYAPSGPVTLRSCLRCLDEFSSESKFDRLCKGCKPDRVSQAEWDQQERVRKSSVARHGVKHG